MTHLDHLLNFFGNPNLDRHRLFQGRWDTYRIEWDDPEAWSDDPLELLLTMLVEELRSTTSEAKPALQALHALAAAAIDSLPHPEFSSITKNFWRGFQFVAQSAAQESGVIFHDLSREDIRQLIEAKYRRHSS